MLTIIRSKGLATWAVLLVAVGVLIVAPAQVRAKAVSLMMPATKHIPVAYSYVANDNGNSITEYSWGANGDVAPVTTISGPSTGLSGPAGVWVSCIVHTRLARTSKCVRCVLNDYNQYTFY